MRLLTILGIISSTLVLSACSTIKNTYYQFVPDRDVTYLEAEVAPSLELPEGITLAENFQSPYTVPKGPLPDEDAGPLNLVPPGGKALWDEAKTELAKQEPREDDE